MSCTSFKSLHHNSHKSYHLCYKMLHHDIQISHFTHLSPFLLLTVWCSGPLATFILCTISVIIPTILCYKMLHNVIQISYFTHLSPFLLLTVWCSGPLATDPHMEAVKGTEVIAIEVTRSGRLVSRPRWRPETRGPWAPGLPTLRLSGQETCSLKLQYQLS